MNINFSELLVILLVALLVIKPERLPEAALTLGRWMKWARQKMSQIKHDFQHDE